MWIGHRKELRKLTFRALASLRRRANARNVGFRIPIHIINPVDKTKLFFLGTRAQAIFILRVACFLG